MLTSEDQVGDDLLKLMRFVDGEDAGANPIDLKPRGGDVDALERLVLGTWEVAAPFGTQGFAGLLRQERRGDEESGEPSKKRGEKS